MTTRILLACGIVICGLTTYVAMGDEQAWVGTDTGDPLVTRESANRIERTLQQRAECDFVDTPLEEACRFIEHAYRIPIWIDKQALQDEGINSDTQVTLIKSGIALESILRLLLEPLALNHLPESGVLIITTQTRADEKMTTRVYPVADLVSAGAEPADYDLLILLIQNTTSGRWYEFDGEGGSVIEFPNARSLIVRHTHKVQREAEGMLAALRKAKQVQGLNSIPVYPYDTDVLTPLEPPVAARPRREATRDVPAWQRPRVHAAE